MFPARKEVGRVCVCSLMPQCGRPWHACPLAAGFEKPSAIQSKGIVPFTKGLDVIQQAQSGTGKTATFCAGILNNLDYNLQECQALVLAPTRELAQQIEKVMRALGDFLQVKCHACVGGTSVREDARILGNGVQVVVGTPGRVFDMLRRRYLRADSIKMFTLDEADEMLSRGFKDQIYDIFQLLPPKLQVRPQLEQLGGCLHRACSPPAVLCAWCLAKGEQHRGFPLWARLAYLGVMALPPRYMCMTQRRACLALSRYVRTRVLSCAQDQALGMCALQVGVFSATLPPEALEITRKFMNKPVGG